MQFVEANGAKIPAVGLGTWELRGRSCARLVEQALKLGYRHIDTAQAYDNEREVGDGLRASRVRRDEVFVTTKVWTNHFAPNDLERSAKESLKKLRLSEVDLLLLHWPNPHVPLQETLGALARVKKLGMCRHIGVSNFTVALIESLERTRSGDEGGHLDEAYQLARAVLAQGPERLGAGHVKVLFETLVRVCAFG